MGPSGLWGLVDYGASWIMGPSGLWGLVDLKNVSTLQKGYFARKVSTTYKRMSDFIVHRLLFHWKEIFQN